MEKETHRLDVFFGPVPERNWRLNYYCLPHSSPHSCPKALKHTHTHSNTALFTRVWYSSWCTVINRGHLFTSDIISCTAWEWRWTRQQKINDKVTNFDKGQDIIIQQLQTCEIRFLRWRLSYRKTKQKVICSVIKITNYIREIPIYFKFRRIKNPCCPDLLCLLLKFGSRHQKTIIYTNLHPQHTAPSASACFGSFRGIFERGRVFFSPGKARRIISAEWRLDRTVWKM